MRSFFLSAIAIAYFAALMGGALWIEFDKAQSESFRYLSAWQSDMSKEILQGQGQRSQSDKILNQLQKANPAINQIQISSDLNHPMKFGQSVFPIYYSALKAGDITITWKLAGLIVAALFSTPFLLALLGSVIFVLVIVLVRQNYQKEKIRLQFQNEKDAELSAMASQVSHDIRGPLTALKTLVALKAHPDDAEFEMLRSVAERIEGIASDLLTNRRQVLAQKNLELLLNEMTAQFSVTHPKQKIDLVFQALQAKALTTPWLGGDFQRVVTNLVQNGLEASQDYINSRNRLEPFELLAAKNTEEEQRAPVIKVIANLVQDDLLISITNEGFGFKSNQIEKIMKGVSLTTKPNGNGLGLSHAVEFIKKLSGEIQITSTPNQILSKDECQTTTVNLRIPLNIAKDKTHTNHPLQQVN